MKTLLSILGATFMMGHAYGADVQCNPTKGYGIIEINIPIYAVYGTNNINYITPPVYDTSMQKWKFDVRFKGDTSHDYFVTAVEENDINALYQEVLEKFSCYH